MVDNEERIRELVQQLKYAEFERKKFKEESEHVLKKLKEESENEKKEIIEGTEKTAGNNK